MHSFTISLSTVRDGTAIKRSCFCGILTSRTATLIVFLRYRASIWPQPELPTVQHQLEFLIQRYTLASRAGLAIQYLHASTFLVRPILMTTPCTLSVSNMASRLNGSGSGKGGGIGNSPKSVRTCNTALPTPIPVQSSMRSTIRPTKKRLPRTVIPHRRCTAQRFR